MEEGEDEGAVTMWKETRRTAGPVENGPGMKWEIYGCTSPGERPKNEDCCGTAQGPSGFCAVLCDGLGGHMGGELASQSVCNSIKEAFRSAPAGADRSRLVPWLVETAQEKLLAQQEKLGAAGGMKTTVCCLTIGGGRAAAAWVGDSRIYFFRKGRILAQSLDHSVPQLLVSMGEIGPKDIRRHPDRNRLLKVLGTPWDRPPYQMLELPPMKVGDCFLLCSDGFWDWIEEEEMEALLHGSRNVEHWAHEMLKVVWARGQGQGMDNVSLIAMECMSSQGDA